MAAGMCLPFSPPRIYTFAFIARVGFLRGVPILQLCDARSSIFIEFLLTHDLLALSARHLFEKVPTGTTSYLLTGGFEPVLLTLFGTGFVYSFIRGAPASLPVVRKKYTAATVTTFLYLKHATRERFNVFPLSMESRIKRPCELYCMANYTYRRANL